MLVSKAKKGVFSASDEVDALRKRCGVLQGNLRAYKETTNATMGENKTRIDSLNKQNKKIRLILSDIDSPHNIESDAAKAFESKRLTKETLLARRQLDEARRVNAEKKEQVVALHDTLMSLEKEDEGLVETREESDAARRVRTVENRLEKAQIKYHEAVNIRETYEALIARLQQERLNYDSQLSQLEKVVAAKEGEMKRMRRILGDATSAREQARKEIEDLELKIQRDRQTRENELDMYKSKVRETLEETAQMEERQQAALIDSRRVSQLEQQQASSSEAEVAAARLREYEDMFERMRESDRAYLLGDPETAVAQMAAQRETEHRLESMQSECQTCITQLQGELATLQRERKSLCFGEKQQLQESVEGADEPEAASVEAVLIERRAKVAEATAELSRLTADTQRSDRTIEESVLAIEFLAKKSRQLGGKSIPTATKGNVNQVLDMLQSQLGAVARAKQKSKQEQTEERVEIALPQHNLRINLPKRDDLDLAGRMSVKKGGKSDVVYADDDDDNAYIDDDVIDREHLKRRSSLVVAQELKADPRLKQRKDKSMKKK